MALRRRGKRGRIARILVWRAGDSASCPTGGAHERTYRWRKGKFRVLRDRRFPARPGSCAELDPDADTENREGGAAGDVDESDGSGPQTSPPNPETSADEPVRNIEPPELFGRAAVGRELSCGGAQWLGSPTEFSYAWSWATLRDGTWGPDSWLAYQRRSYVVRREDLGKAVWCSVIGRRGFGAWSGRVWATQPLVVEPLNVVRPVTTAPDGAVATRTLACETGSWEPAGVSTVRTVTWRRNGELVADANDGHYETTRADADAELRCIVTARSIAGWTNGEPRPGSAPVTVESAPITVSACGEHASPYCVDPASGHGSDAVHVESLTRPSTPIVDGKLTTTATRESANPAHGRVEVTWEFDLAQPATIQLAASWCWRLRYRPCRDADDITTKSLPAGHHVVAWTANVDGEAPMEGVTVSVFDLQQGAALGTNHHVFSR